MVTHYTYTPYYSHRYTSHQVLHITHNIIIYRVRSAQYNVRLLFPGVYSAQFHWAQAVRCIQEVSAISHLALI